MAINVSQNIMIDPNEPLILPDRTALTGRIEWFLYSLCLLDYENLPTPMSRIEQFTNALVTGEVPNIEPQSRVEEYFLAILTGDVENLPEPESRVEVLLDKLARGEFDLSDVEPIQSRYELLIAYLIKNSGIGDITYVLHEFLGSDTPYTMYNTKEKPTKSAILKGNTLVNLSNPTNEVWRSNAINAMSKHFNIINTVVGDKYTILIFDYSEKVKKFRLSEDNGVNRQFEPQSIKSLAFNCTINNNKMYLYLYADDGVELTTDDVENVKMVILKGDFTNQDIPYFEGMQSVKMPVLTTTGKNLFDGKWIKGKMITEDGSIISDNGSQYSESFIRVSKGKYISSNNGTNRNVNMFKYDFDGNFIGRLGTTGSTFTVDGDCLIRFSLGVNNTDYFQFEQGTVATTYEPFKSNILTVNEDVTLRGIGDVQDTLDCLTGEVTQRVGEIVLDGSENWALQTSSTDIRGNIYRLSITDIDTTINNSYINCLCDKAMVSGWNNILGNPMNKTFAILQNQQLRVQFDGTLEELKLWLSETQPTIQYLKQEVIKTVDLSILDQDGVTVDKLNTFKDITHVSCSVDEGSIYPYVEMEVATSNDEDLAAIGLKLEEKNKVQSKLIKVNDYQSDVIDNVMLGITEIYESI